MVDFPMLALGPERAQQLSDNGVFEHRLSPFLQS